MKISYIFLGFFLILVLFSFFAVKLVLSNSLISYPENEKISLRSDSVHRGRPSFFYNPAIRFPTDDGGFGFGK